MHSRLLWSAIVRRDSNEDVFRGGLGILDDDIKITVFVEDTGIEQLKLRFFFRTTPIFFQQLSIGIGALRIFVKELHVGVGRRAVEVEVIFLHILAVIAFVAGKAEETLLENGIGLVPKCKTKTHELMAVADRRQAVFVPAIGARPSVIVRKIFPRLSGGAVVLAHCAPGAIADIGAPALPMGFAGSCFFQTFLFCVHGVLKLF